MYIELSTEPTDRQGTIQAASLGLVDYNHIEEVPSSPGTFVENGTATRTTHRDHADSNLWFDIFTSTTNHEWYGSSRDCCPLTLGLTRSLPGFSPQGHSGEIRTEPLFVFV